VRRKRGAAAVGKKRGKKGEEGGRVKSTRFLAKPTMTVVYSNARLRDADLVVDVDDGRKKRGAANPAGTRRCRVGTLKKGPVISGSGCLPYGEWVAGLESTRNKNSSFRRSIPRPIVSNDDLMGKGQRRGGPVLPNGGVVLNQGGREIFCD